MIRLNVSCVVYDLLLFYLVVLFPQLIQNLLKRSQLVSVMNVDEVRFDIMWNGIIVLRFPESSLSSRTDGPIEISTGMK